MVFDDEEEEAPAAASPAKLDAKRQPIGDTSGKPTSHRAKMFGIFSSRIKPEPKPVVAAEADAKSYPYLAMPGDTHRLHDIATLEQEEGLVHTKAGPPPRSRNSQKGDDRRSQAGRVSRASFSAAPDDEAPPAFLTQPDMSEYVDKLKEAAMKMGEQFNTFGGEMATAIQTCLSGVDINSVRDPVEKCLISSTAKAVVAVEAAKAAVKEPLDMCCMMVCLQPLKSRGGAAQPGGAPQRPDNYAATAAAQPPSQPPAQPPAQAPAQMAGEI